MPQKAALRAPKVMAATGFALCGAGLLAACDRQEAQNPVVLPTAAATASPAAPAIPVISDPLGRSDLIAAARAATDAVAAGRDMPRSNLSLTNRTFSLRLPFGCPGLDSAPWAQTTFDAATQILRITVRPERWAEPSPILTLYGPSRAEAAEGFWIDRPWTSAETCPTQPDAPATETPPGESAATDGTAPSSPVRYRTLAIAHFFTTEEPRTWQRRNRPYSFTGKVAGLTDPPPGSFGLRLGGRISGFPDGQPIHCALVDPGAPPTCVIAVELTHVAFESTLTGETIIQWTR